MTDSIAAGLLPTVPTLLPESTVPVSVVIPCYNSELTLECALLSVMAQTLRPLEILVVDDGSSDDSSNVVERLAVNSAVPLRLIRSPENVGVASARNLGWAEAKGTFIAFLDADDAWHPRKIEHQLPLMLDNPDLALCGSLFLVEQPDTPHVEIDTVRLRDLPMTELLKHNRLTTSGVMLRRDLPNRFENGRRYGEDYKLWLQIALSHRQVGAIDPPLVRIHKPPYGASGLSARLWKMEQAELEVYLSLRQGKMIGHRRWLQVSVFSLVKYLRRLLVVALGSPGKQR